MSGDPSETTKPSNQFDRRSFIGSAAATAGFMIINPSLVRGTQANSAIRVGLLGCGGRGTEDATNLLDAGARIVALGDLFQNQLDAARAHFNQLLQAKNFPILDTTQLFAGPDAFQKIAASKEVDAIVVATPPYFHPQHLEAVVAAGKHVYLEKPVAVDVAGAIGNIVCGEAHYLTGYIDRPQWPKASPEEVRLRNWVHDKVLSGDIIVEQNIHVIDICNWVLQSHPLKASAAGGRMGRPANDGDAWGNYHVVFQYPNGVDVTFSSTQFAKGWWDVTERFFGTKGTSQSPYVGPLGIWGDEPWQDPGSQPKPADASKPQAAFSVTGNFSSNLEQADPEKKKAFLESITSGKFHNQSGAGAESALSCMMARTAAYTGHEVSWDELLKSTEVWDPHLDLNKIVANQPK